MYFQIHSDILCPRMRHEATISNFFIRIQEISICYVLASDLEQFKEFPFMPDVKSKLNHGTSSEPSNEGKVLRTINYFGNSVPAYRTASRQ